MLLPLLGRDGGRRGQGGAVGEGRGGILVEKRGRSGCLSLR